MRIAFLPSFRIAAGLLLVVLLGVVGCQVLRWRNPVSPEALLARADEMSWLNSWIGAEPLYGQAELQFTQRYEFSRALYARVSEMPAHSESSTSVPAQIALLTHDLALPEAQEPETRLRVLTILGMLEVNYDAGMARKTWADVEALAIRQHHYLLASRAMGEQGIAAFLLGDIATAKKNVVKAWFVAKTADPGAHIRYASMYGAGLVEMRKYKEALGPLDEAIKVAKKTRGAAYPTIAITAKVEALSGLGETKEALALASEEMRRVSGYNLAGHLYELYQTRAGVYERMGQWDQAVSDYGQAVQYAKQLSYWRGLTQVDGSLATAYGYSLRWISKLIEERRRHLRTASVMNAGKNDFQHLVLHYVFVQSIAPMVSSHLDWVPGTAKGRRVAEIEIEQVFNVHSVKQRCCEDIKTF